MPRLCSAFVLAVVGLSVADACGATKVYVAAGTPAQVKIPANIKRIAVVEFTPRDEPSRAYAGIAAARLNSLLASAPDTPYQLLDRTHLKGVLAEQDLGASGVTDSATAVKAGKMLNVDAIIFGSVHAETTDQIEEKPSVRIGGGGIPSVGGKSSLRRSALVNVTFNMIQPETGEVITTRSISRSYDSSKSGGGLLKKVMPGGGPPSGDAIINDLIEQCVAEFGGLIAPHYEVYEFELGSSRGTKTGNTFAEAGDFATAAKQYEAAMGSNAKEHAAVYNLAVARLALNDAKAATELFDKAVTLKADKKYIKGRQQVVEILKQGEGVQFRPASNSEIAAAKSRLKEKD
jgi:tetratricopeptide (TPR) repeat protein